MMRRATPLLALVLLAAGVGLAAPGHAACQDLDNQVEECMCIYASPAQQFKRSNLVFIGRVSDRQAPELDYGVGGPRAKVIVIERLEKGRVVGRRIKVLDPPRYGGCTCGSGPPDDLRRYRFYVTPSHDQPGYYVVDSLLLPD
jgi:hypothetical protein